MVVVVLFWSGIQKLFHGYWFQGQFLAYSLWRPTFQGALGPLLPIEELERLVGYGADAGAGPFVLSSPVGIVISNIIWLAEIVLGLMLIPRATRQLAWIGACVLLVLTEVVAREFMFGVEFACALTLFSPGPLIRRLVWPVATFLVVLVLIRGFLAPAVVFH
jgi:hypothetical protein